MNERDVAIASPDLSPHPHLLQPPGQVLLAERELETVIGRNDGERQVEQPSKPATPTAGLSGQSLARLARVLTEHGGPHHLLSFTTDITWHSPAFTSLRLSVGFSEPATPRETATFRVSALLRDHSIARPIRLSPLLGALAEFERELLMERTREGQLRKVRSQPWSCGPAPYGYRREDGEVVQVPEECEVVRRIFRLYLEMGTYKGVARRLTEEGIPAPRGKKWWGETVKGILTNPVYAGCNVYGRYEKGNTLVKPREEWTVVPGMREAVVSETIFRHVHKCDQRSGGTATSSARRG